PISWELVDGTIILRRSENPTVGAQVSAEENRAAQQRRISGKVSDESGNPIQGASVVVTGTSNGTSTDANGNFSLEVSGSNISLSVSYIGFLKSEVSIGNQQNINIILKEDLGDLDRKSTRLNSSH